jgi:hypothetical protein
MLKLKVLTAGLCLASLKQILLILLHTGTKQCVPSLRELVGSFGKE